MLIRRSTREGWIRAAEDWIRLREPLEDRLACGELHPRQAGQAAAILADLAA